VCLGQLCLSLFLWSTARWGPWGTWQHRSSPLGKVRPGPRGSVEAHLDREARSGAEEHVATPELSSRGGRARSHGTRGNTGAHLDREARSRAEKRVAAPELNSARRRGLGPRGSTGAHLSKEVRSEAAGHVAAPEPTSAGSCGSKLHLAWQRVDARSTPYLNLELVCEGTRSSGWRQRFPTRSPLCCSLAQVAAPPMCGGASSFLSCFSSWACPALDACTLDCIAFHSLND
jgi:hypothetical protein